VTISIQLKLMPLYFQLLLYLLTLACLLLLHDGLFVLFLLAE